MFNIKERLKQQGKTQVWLIFQLQDEGITVQPQEMSSILSGVMTSPKAKRVLAKADDILHTLERGEKDG